MAEDLLAIAQRHLYPNYRQPPVVLTRGRGLEVWDTDGKLSINKVAGQVQHCFGCAFLCAY